MRYYYDVTVRLYFVSQIVLVRINIYFSKLTLVTSAGSSSQPIFGNKKSIERSRDVNTKQFSPLKILPINSSFVPLRAICHSVFFIDKPHHLRHQDRVQQMTSPVRRTLARNTLLRVYLIIWASHLYLPSAAGSCNYMLVQLSYLGWAA